MKIRKFLFDFFHFNKQERNGILVLLVLIFATFMFRMWLPYFMSDEKMEFLQLPSIPADSLVVAGSQNNVNVVKPESNQVNNSRSLFVFNPNSITYEDALRLGFPQKTANILLKFRTKGGRFYKREDLKKLYGLDEGLYNKLESYILIPLKSDSLNKSIETKKYQAFKIKQTELIDLNAADSSQIVDLKGVGPAFTKRIMKYRKLLGGFHSLYQLKEVYGMTDSLYDQLSLQVKINPETIEKIPINLVDVNELKKHPYFNYRSAAALVNYRSKHGRLTPEDLKNIGVFDEEKSSRILPYLLF